MITKFHIENFKSLVKFDLPPNGFNLESFTCLIGLNGAGKSTLLQAFDFAAHIVSGKVVDWLAQRNWKAGDVVSNLGKRSPVVSIGVHFQDESGTETTWHARFNTTLHRCTYEKVECAGKTLLEVESERLALAGQDGELKRKEEKQEYDYKGSVLSLLKLQDYHAQLSVVRDSLLQLKSLELLSPQLLRKRAYAAKDIGVGGEKLSAFLAGMAVDKKKSLLIALQSFYPNLQDWRIRSLQSGWKDLNFVESYQGSHTVQAAHINDGLLRVMAILAQAHSSHSFFLFDEIENGINPEVVEKLMDFLVALGGQGKQVVVTTHSPVILNYLEDEVARNGVILLYKSRDGHTHSCRYFDQPETGFKLEALGPGEVFVDTDLNRIVHRLNGESLPSNNSLGGKS